MKPNPASIKPVSTLSKSRRSIGVRIYASLLILLSATAICCICTYAVEDLSHYGQPEHCVYLSEGVMRQPVTDVWQDVTLLAVAILIATVALGARKHQTLRYRVFALLVPTVALLVSLAAIIGEAANSISCIPF